MPTDWDRLDATTGLPKHVTCACVSTDARECIRHRYARWDEDDFDEDEACECSCHDDDPDYTEDRP